LFELDLLTAVHGVLNLAMVDPQIDFQPRDVGEMTQIKIEVKVLFNSDQPIAFHELELGRR
jgi:hypothetical protein